MARAKRRTNSEIFIDALKHASGGNQILVSNLALREALKWDRDQYDRVKSQLLAEDALIVGRGYGGTVGLANAPGSTALSLFISYSHADELLKKALLQHLEPLKKLGLIQTWHDQLIRPGDSWDKVISAQLENADIILLLISIDFINSGYCYDLELDKALELHAEGKAKVIPIILRNCLWKHTKFASLQALPKAGLPVISWGDQDSAFVDIAEGVKLTAEDLLRSK